MIGKIQRIGYFRVSSADQNTERQLDGIESATPSRLPVKA